MQALYQWQLTEYTPEHIERQFLVEEDMRKADVPYFQKLIQEIPAHIGEFDETLSPLLDRPIKQLDPIERALLWIGLYELQYVRDIPWRVVINEAVELAKQFGADQSYKYINGVLDKIARRLEDGDS